MAEVRCPANIPTSKGRIRKIKNLVWSFKPVNGVCLLGPEALFVFY
jgi:hypothetical protein